MRLSPLRYAGGKSKGVKVLKDYIPENTQSICSPFFGGGSLELYCASNGRFCQIDGSLQKILSVSSVGSFEDLDK